MEAEKEAMKDTVKRIIPSPEPVIAFRPTAEQTLEYKRESARVSRKREELLDQLTRQRRTVFSRRINLIVKERYMNEWSEERRYEEEAQRLREVMKRAKKAKRDGVAVGGSGKPQAWRPPFSRTRGNTTDNESSEESSDPQSRRLKGLTIPAPVGSQASASSLLSPTTTAGGAGVDAQSRQVAMGWLQSSDPIEAKRVAARMTLARDPLHLDFLSMTSSSNQIISVVAPALASKASAGAGAGGLGPGAGADDETLHTFQEPSFNEAGGRRNTRKDLHTTKPQFVALPGVKQAPVLIARKK
jgi:hypothetical protein